MEQFLSKHADAVIGTLSGFDRLVFRGTLRRRAHRFGLMAYLWKFQVMAKDFANYAEALRRQLKVAGASIPGLGRRAVRSISAYGRVRRYR